MVHIPEDHLAARLAPPPPAPDEDFGVSVSVHAPALMALKLDNLLGQSEPHSLRSLAALVTRSLAVEKQILDDLRFGSLRTWAEAGLAKSIAGPWEVSLLARRTDQPKAAVDDYRVCLKSNLTVAGAAAAPSGPSAITLDEKSLTIEVVEGGRDAADRAAFQPQLRAGGGPHVRLVSWQLLRSSNASSAADGEGRPNHKHKCRSLRLLADQNYLTLAGQLEPVD